MRWPPHAQSESNSFHGSSLRWQDVRLPVAEVTESATTSLVANGLATPTCGKRGGGRVAVAVGRAVDAEAADFRAVQEISFTARMAWELFGSGFVGLRGVEGSEGGVVCGI